MANDSFYQKLTRLFRSGPSIRRKIRGQDFHGFYDKQVVHNNLNYYGPSAFKREASPFSILGAYGLLDRMSRYAEFAEMEYEASIGAALDIYADEACSGDESGKCFHVHSDNPDIQKALEELFYEVANIEFDLRRWIRNLIKYGDFFLYVEVQPNTGVLNVQPIPVNEVEREEGFDKDDPYAVRFRLLTKSGKILENWQVVHFRILGNDLFLPYGSSFLESARRPFRQLIMMEDAMLVYRLIRSPERRVFYVDVSGINPNDIPSYMEAVKEQLRGASTLDKITGRHDYRYNPLSVDDDYFLPTRPNSQTKIDTLSGGQHQTATEDVEFIQKKLFSALKIPKAYLGYDESLSSKATLAQEDIRFSRTITNLQKIVIAELNTLAILHLFAKGFDGEDLINYELRLSNPSTLALQQKLQLWSNRFEAASKAKESELVDQEWIQKEILGLRIDEIRRIRDGQLQDAMRKKLIEEPPTPVINQKSSVVDPFDQTNYNILPSTPLPPQPPKLVSKISAPPKSNPAVSRVSLKKGELPITPSTTPNLARAKKNASRHRTHGPDALSMPDFKRMLDMSTNTSLKDVYDTAFLKNPLLEDIEEGIGASSGQTLPANVSRMVTSMLKRFNETLRKETQEIELDLITEDTSEKTVDELLDELKDDQF